MQTQGPLSDAVAQRLIDRGRAKLEAGDAALAVADFQRVVGHDDPAITGAALLGYGDALYRLDNEDQAKAAWEAVTRLPENPSTYRAWRNLAGVRVRAGELKERHRCLPRGGPARARRGQGGDRRPPRLAGEGDRQHGRGQPVFRPEPGHEGRSGSRS